MDSSSSFVYFTTPAQDLLTREMVVVTLLALFPTIVVSLRSSGVVARSTVIDVELVRSEEAMRQDLLVAMAATDRGQAKSSLEAKKTVEDLVERLEACESKGSVCGRWALAYCSTQLFRSSPFWMAGRETCSDEAEARRYDLFCDLHRAATAVGSIGAVRQIIDNRTLTSEFETTVAAMPQRVGGALPLTVQGSIVSKADILDASDDGIMTLLMDTVQIKGSNIPGLRNILDSDAGTLYSRQISRLVTPEPPKPQFQTTYVDDTLRIARDLPDRQIFIYVKESDDTTPTNYDDVSADLGIPSLVQNAVDAFLA